MSSERKITNQSLTTHFEQKLAASRGRSYRQCGPPCCGRSTRILHGTGAARFFAPKKRHMFDEISRAENLQKIMKNDTQCLSEQKG